MLDGALETIVASTRDTSARWATGAVCDIDKSHKATGRLNPLPEWVPTSMVACLGWSPIHRVATAVRLSATYLS